MIYFCAYEFEFYTLRKIYLQHLKMSTKKERELHEEKEWNKVDELVVSSESFILKYGKQLLIGFGVILLIVAIYFAYLFLYLGPKNKNAEVAIFKGQQYFEAGMDSLALNGDNNGYIGFNAIISEYGSTKTGNLAKIYAGLSYARLGDSESALKYLQDAKADDYLVSPSLTAAIGDCMVNVGKINEAADLFMKAAKTADNNLLSPRFYKKAALTYRSLKDYTKEIEVLTIIKNNYMNSPEAQDVEKYIIEAEALKGGK